MKASELFAKATMHVVRKGRNVKYIGWCDGYILVRFQHPALYIYGPNVPELKLTQILNNPYPDALFNRAIKNKFQCFKAAA